MPRENGDYIESISKAFKVLQAFSQREPRLTVTRAAELAGLTRPTARRILLTCTTEGFMETDGKEYWLTPRVMRLGFGFLSTLPYWEAAQPHMRELAETVNESCSMATLDGNEIVYLTRVPGRRAMTTTLNVGSRLPAYATSLGKVLLAFSPDSDIDRYLSEVSLTGLTPNTITDAGDLREELARIRAQGYATADGEREIGIRSASAPIQTPSGRVVAALNVSANSLRVSHEDLVAEYVPRIIETARTISGELGYSGLY